MSGSAPSDLAVVFAGLERRIRLALEPVDGDRSVARGPLDSLDRLVASAAHTMGSAADPAAVAAAIEQRPADDWTDASLEQLRAIALQVGSEIRSVESLAEKAAGR